MKYSSEKPTFKYHGQNSDLYSYDNVNDLYRKIDSFVTRIVGETYIDFTTTVQRWNHDTNQFHGRSSSLPQALVKVMQLQDTLLTARIIKESFFIVMPVNKCNPNARPVLPGTG